MVANPLQSTPPWSDQKDLPSKYLDLIPAGEGKPGLTSSRAFKEDDTTTTVTTTLIPVRGLPEGDESDFAKLKEQGFPGFDIVSPDNSSTKPCTVTTSSVKEGKKVTTIISQKYQIFEKSAMLPSLYLMKLKQRRRLSQKH